MSGVIRDDALSGLGAGSTAQVVETVTSQPLAQRVGDPPAITSHPAADPQDTASAQVIGIEALERVMAAHWQAPDREPLGGWLLRAAGGFTGRANSVLTVGDPGLPPPRALSVVRAWYAARGLPATASVTGPTGPPLPEAGAHHELGPALAADGWHLLEGAGALVLTSALEPLQTCGPDEPADGLRLRLATAPDPAWLSRYRYRGQELPPNAVGLLLSASDQVFCSIQDGDRTAAVARGSFGGGWVGVTAVEVDPHYRRRGLAVAMLAAIARWGVEAGAANAYLQVGDANAGALALYRKVGFTTHHRYDYVRAH